MNAMSKFRYICFNLKLSKNAYIATSFLGGVRFLFLMLLLNTLLQMIEKPVA